MIGMVKERARAALNLRYWPIVGIELIAGALMGGVSGFSGSVSGNNSRMNELMENPQFRTIMLAILGITLAVSVVGILYTFLFGNVIKVGISGIRLKAYRKETFRIVELFSGLKQYKRIVGTMALYTLFVTLGFMCFIVPGIIVALGLFEVPYLLNEDPSLSGMDAIRRSWENMKGHKGELFGLAMSFFGWIMLTILTLGVLAIFYTGPYMALAEAGYYHELHHSVNAETFTADSFHE
ncbi:MAG: DUF975 family protein [Clostridia bacterium]|nr:DUF975 family protein [Clostridia bacterium]